MIFLKNIVKIYKGSKRSAVTDVTIEFADKGFIFLTGPSGAGKTTLLNIIGLLLKPSSGKIQIDNGGEKPEELRENLISYVFQSYDLIEEFDVLENLLVMGIDESEAEDLLRRVQLLEKIHDKISYLSGGEKQRLAVARGLAKKAEIFLIDEPTASLDAANAQIVFDLLQEVSKTHLVIAVSHDRQQIERYADRLIEMKSGQIVSDSGVKNPAAENMSKKSAHVDIFNSRFVKLFLKRTLTKSKIRQTVQVVLVGLIGMVTAVAAMFASYRYERNDLKILAQSGIDQIGLTERLPSKNFQDRIKNDPDYQELSLLPRQTIKFYSAEINDFYIDTYILDANSSIKIDGAIVKTPPKNTIAVSADAARLLWQDHETSKDFIYASAGEFAVQIFGRASKIKFDRLASSQSVRAVMSYETSRLFNDSFSSDSCLEGTAGSIDYSAAYESLPQGDFLYVADSFKERGQLATDEIVVNKSFYENILSSEIPSDYVFTVKASSAADIYSYDFSPYVSSFKIVGILDDRQYADKIIISPVLFNKIGQDNYYFATNLDVKLNAPGKKFYQNHREEFDEFEIYIPNILSGAISSEIGAQVIALLLILLLLFAFLIVFFNLRFLRKGNRDIFAFKALGLSDRKAVRPYLIKTGLESGAYIGLTLFFTGVAHGILNLVLGGFEAAESGLTLTVMPFSPLGYLLPIAAVVLLELVVAAVNYLYISHVEVAFGLAERRK